MRKNKKIIILINNAGLKSVKHAVFTLPLQINEQLNYKPGNNSSGREYYLSTDYTFVSTVPLSWGNF